MNNPQPGDWEIEISTIHNNEIADIRKVGKLMKVGLEPYNTEGDDETACRKVLTIKTLDGDLIKWDNSRFIAIPGK